MIVSTEHRLGNNLQGFPQPIEPSPNEVQSTSYSLQDIGKIQKIVETFTPITNATIPTQKIHGGSQYSNHILSFDSETQFQTVYDNFNDGNRIDALIDGFKYTAIIQNDYAYFEDGYRIYRDPANHIMQFYPAPGVSSAYYHTVSAVVGTIGAAAEFVQQDMPIEIAWGTTTYCDEHNQEKSYDTILSIDSPANGITAEEIYEAIETGKNVYFKLINARLTRRYTIARLVGFDDTKPHISGTTNTCCLFNPYNISQGRIRGYRFSTIPDNNNVTKEWTQTIIDVIFYDNFYGADPSGYYLVVNNSWEGRVPGGEFVPVMV